MRFIFRFSVPNNRFTVKSAIDGGLGRQLVATCARLGRVGLGRLVSVCIHYCYSIVK